MWQLSEVLCGECYHLSALLGSMLLVFSILSILSHFVTKIKRLPIQSLWGFLSVSIALSNRGTVVMESSLVRALTAIDQAIADRSRAEASCMGCMPCLFQDCGQHSGTCGEHIHIHITLNNHTRTCHVT